MPLKDELRKATQRALHTGALQPISTRFEVIRDGGLDFMVRVVESLERKALDTIRSKPTLAGSVSPFLPHDPDLYVGPAGPRHFLVLNKYPVLDGHVLVVTRRFEEQESRITADDFSALWRCLGRMDGLAFYNAGRVAGASQGHKHLQLVSPGPVPIEPLVAAARFSGRIGHLEAFAFRHALAKLDPGWRGHPPRAGERTADLYERLLTEVGKTGADRYSAYNLLVTRRWMLLVPRANETCEGVMVNALGFAGMLLARNKDELARVRKVGPMKVLTSVACA